MKIVYTTTVAGPAGTFREGDERDDVPDKLGAVLIAQGVARAVGAPPAPPIETAEAPAAAELATATPPAAKKGGRGFSKRA